MENLAELVAVAREFADEPVAGPSADPADETPAAPGSPTSWSGWRWSPTPTRSPTSRAERRRRGHADDPAHRQGPGVPGGVPHRPGGRRLPAPCARSATSPSWRRSAGWPTSASPAPSSGSTCPGPWCAPPGARRRTTRRPGSSTSCPVDLVDWRRTEAAQTSWNRPVLPSLPPRNAGAPTRRFGAAAARADADARGKKREVPTLEPGDRVLHDSVRDGQRGRARRAPATRPWPRSTSARRASSGCCCATPRSRSSDAAGSRYPQRLDSGAPSVRRMRGVRVDRVAGAGPDLEVHVRAGGVAGGADRPMTWPARDVLADADRERGLVAVPELGAVVEGHDGLVAVGPGVAGLGDRAVGDRVDRGARRGRRSPGRCGSATTGR